MARLRPFRHTGALDDRYRVDAYARRMRLIETHRITLLLDVGANTGQYARELRDLGFRGRLEYGFCNPFTARMLQVDGLLFRPSDSA